MSHGQCAHVPPCFPYASSADDALVSKAGSLAQSDGTSSHLLAVAVYADPTANAGNPESKGISGGQAKRTNIGIALITNPRWGSHGLTKTQCRCCKESVIQIRSTSTAD